MRKLLQYISLASVCVLLWGCPYESQYPIDNKPSIKTDSRLLGKWGPADGRMGDSCIITQADDYRYYITIYSPSIKGNTGGYAWLSKVGTSTYLNLKEENDMAQMRFIILDSVSDNSFSYRTISDINRKKALSSDDLRKWIETNQKNNSFFEKGDNMIRLK